MVITKEKQNVNIRHKNVYLDSANTVKTVKKDKQKNTPKERRKYSKSGKKLNIDYHCDNCNFYLWSYKNQCNFYLWS